MDNSSKVIVITGASSGIGQAIVTYLSLNSTHRIVATVRKDDDKSQLSNLKKVDPFIMDITSEDDIHDFALYLKKKYSKVDALINNAGITGWGAIMDRDIDYFRKVMEVNLFGPIMLTKELYPLIQSAGGNPVIINISSQAGNYMMPFWAPYHMSKLAFESFSVCLRRELLLTGIRVAVIQPGAFKSDAFIKEIPSYEEYMDNPENKFRSLAKNILKPAFYGKSRKEKDPVIIAKCILEIIEKRATKFYFQPGKRLIPDLFMQKSPPSIIDLIIRKLYIKKRR